MVVANTEVGCRRVLALVSLNLGITEETFRRVPLFLVEGFSINHVLFLQLYNGYFVGWFCELHLLHRQLIAFEGRVVTTPMSRST